MLYTYYTNNGKFTTDYYNGIPFLKLIDNDFSIFDEEGTKEWYEKGKKYRLDGPAVIWYDGEEEWRIKGKRINTNQVEKWIKDNNINLKNKKHQVLFMKKFG